MNRLSRVVRLGVIPVVAVVVLAACSSGKGGSKTPGPGGSSTPSNAPAGFNAATTSIVNASTKPGGTLRLGSSGDCDSWDPQATYYGFCWTLQRLFTRTLMAFNSAAGTAGTKVVPDMATAAGETNADKTVWTYHLQPGLKFSDGEAITSKDVKYGIERMYATDVISGGPNSYYLCLLDKCDAKGTTTYPGPYKNKAGLSSIATPDDTTIIFHLNAAYSDFDYLMALPAGAPVPQKKDTGASYTNHVVASGPFMFQSYTPKQSVVWVRNPNWSQSTDKVRKPLATKVTLTILSNADDVDNRLKNGSLDLGADGGVQASFQSQITQDKKLLAQADDPYTGYVWYIVVMPTVKPFDNVHCRMAVAYALNKRDLRIQRGGTYGGDYATTMIHPAVPGYDKDANPYPSGADWQGDLTKAKDELKLCGQPNGFNTNMAYRNTRRDPQIFPSVQAALKRVGINVTGKQADTSVYYKHFIGSPSNIKTQGLGIASAGWAADFYTGTGFYNALANGKTIQQDGNTDYPSLNDPTSNSLFVKALQSDASQQVDIFKELDKDVMAQAVYIPYVYDKAVFYRNARVTNLYMLAGTGYWYDAVNAGTSDGK